MVPRSSRCASVMFLIIFIFQPCPLVPTHSCPLPGWQPPAEQTPSKPRSTSHPPRGVMGRLQAPLLSPWAAAPCSPLSMTMKPRSGSDGAHASWTCSVDRWPALPQHQLTSELSASGVFTSTEIICHLLQWLLDVLPWSNSWTDMRAFSSLIDFLLFLSPSTIFIIDQNVPKCSKWVFLFQNFPGGNPLQNVFSFFITIHSHAWLKQVRFLGTALSGSIPWLLMPWRLASSGHQEPWYWICLNYFSDSSYCHTYEHNT